MANASVTRQRALAAVALLTIGWVVAVLALLWRCFGIGLEAWAEDQSDSARLDALHHRAAVAAALLAGVAVGGPVLIAVVAFVNRMARAGTVYVVLAVVLAVFALPFAAQNSPAPSRPSPSTSTPYVCQEHSGGDNRCPGG